MGHSNRRLPLAAVVLLAIHGGVAQTLTLTVAGASRTSLIHTPSGLDRPALVLVLHGLGGSGSDMQSSTQMDKVADREKFVVAYPSAVGGTWDYAGAKNDYSFFKAIIDSTVARYQVDRDRVYLTGFSQGGGEAVYAAFSYPDIYAAVAPVSSVGSGAPTPKRPIPILLTFGTKDLYTPATFMASVSGWLKFDSCSGSPTAIRPYPATNPKSVVTRLVYGGCAEGVSIVVDSIQGGGHEWPNNTSTKVNNAEEVWAFFKPIRLLRGTAGVRSPHSGESAFRTDGRTVLLPGIEEGTPVRLMDPQGRPMARTRVSRGTVDLPTGTRGVVLLEFDRPAGRSVVRLVSP